MSKRKPDPKIVKDNAQHVLQEHGRTAASRALPGASNCANGRRRNEAGRLAEGPARLPPTHWKWSIQ